MYTIFLCGGSLFGGLTGGYIGYHYGWTSIFWVSTALSGFVFLTVLLFVPETLYDRVSTDDASLSSEDNKNPDTKEVETVQVQPQVSYESFTFLQSLNVNVGRHESARASLVQYFIQPWKTLALPGTWVVMLHYAGLVGGIVTVSLIGPQIVAMPPYLWGANAGLINVGAVIGCVVGYVYTAVLADRQLKVQAKKQHHGMAEAEDRLPTLFFPLVVATCGFFVFGFCAQNPGPNRWVGMQFGYGMIAFGLTQVPSVGFNYVSRPTLPALPRGLFLIVSHSSLMRMVTWLPTALPSSPSSAPSLPLRGPSSSRPGFMTEGRPKRSASLACSWVFLGWSLFPCGCLASA